MAADTISFTLKNDAGSTLFSFNLPLFKLDATTAPVVGDDDVDGYVAGSLWVDRTNDKVYVCTDNATGAAVWVQIAGTGAGGGTNALLDGASHTDTVAQAVTRGSLIYGDSTPKWNELVVGAANALLGTDGTDVSWFGCTAAGRAILDDADAAAQRTTLGLAIGTNVQAYDATLAALAAFNTNGILTQTAADTFTGRTITGTANEITVTNGDGVAGNPTLSLPTDLHIPGAVTLLGDVAASLTGSTNNWNPHSSTSCIIRVTSDATGAITGIAGGDDGRVLMLVNVDVNSFTIHHQSGSSSAANRIITHTAGSIQVGENDTAILIYDATSSRWRVIASTGFQEEDATLTAFAAYNTNGLLTQTAANTFTGRTITGTANQITVTDGNGVSGNPTLSLPADVLIPTVLTVPNTGLHILDTNASHDLIIAPGSNITADRTLTITTGDANRTLTFTADASIGGTNTGDQTVPSAAAQSDQETATSTTTYVSPGRQQYHPSACKGWIDVDMTSAGWTINASYNVTGVNDTSAGTGSVDWSTDLSSGNYCVLVWGDSDLTTPSNAGHMINQTGKSGATWTFRTNTSAGTATDYKALSIAVFGDQ